jgi:hypothetical protein
MSASVAWMRYISSSSHAPGNSQACLRLSVVCLGCVYIAVYSDREAMIFLPGVQTLYKITLSYSLLL